MLNLFLGGVFGLLCLLPYVKAQVKALALNGYVALAMMLMIYLGAHLVSSDTTRLAYELLLVFLVLGLATWFRSKWPLGIAILILMHGAYDFFLGHDSGVVDWYPPVCSGFDVVVGVGLAALILKRRQTT